MSKKHGRHRRGGRVTPKGTRPLGYDDRGARGQLDEPDLMVDLRRSLAADHPLALLAEASALWAALDPRRRSPLEREPDGPAALSREEVVQSFLDVDRPETSGLLAVIAELAGDEVLRARIGRELATRGDALPHWLARLGEVEPYRAEEMVHVLGDGDDLMLGVHLPDGHDLTVVVYIDHNLGTVVKDAFVVPEPISELIEAMRAEVDDPDVAWNEMRLADARARITEAIELGAITVPPFETDTWPACRPLVEWFTRVLPDGGTGYVRPEWKEEALSKLAEQFFVSPFAADLDDDDYPSLLESLLWFGSGYGPGDPLRWSPPAVEILLTDWIPRKIVAPPEYLTKAPELLRAFIRYCHHKRGIRPGLTAETLEAVDRWESEYQDTIRSPRPQGPMALLAAMGAVDPDGPWDLPIAPALPGPSPARSRRREATTAALEVVECAAAAPVLDRFDRLVEFYGAGRKLTQTGQPTLADARQLVTQLETHDRVDETIGEHTFKTKSAAELPELSFTIRWAVAAGALRKQHGKLQATNTWRKLAGRPLERWLRATDALNKVGPLAGFYAHVQDRQMVQFIDEFVPDMLDDLTERPMAFEEVLDTICAQADAAFEWVSGYWTDPDARRRSFQNDLDTLTKILGWTGLVERVGSGTEPDRWDPERLRLIGGELRLSAAGAWWLDGF